MGKPFVDMTGVSIGNLKVIGLSNEKLEGRTEAHWIVECGLCGEQKIYGGMTLRDMRNPHAKCKSCFTKTSSIIGVGASTLYKQYAFNAKARNLEYSLSPEQFVSIAQNSCHYCGDAPGNFSSGYKYNGIDRVDNNKGYFIENCVACCKICNRAKRELSLEDFLSWIRRIREYS